MPTTRSFVGMTAFVIAVLYACSDEIHQLFIDGRAGQVADVLVDASGAAIGCLLTCILMWRFMTRRMRRRECRHYLDIMTGMFSSAGSSR